jgi:hypothetical protein
MKWLWSNELKRIWKDAVLVQYGIFIAEAVKSYENFCQDKEFPSRELNSKP